MSRNLDKLFHLIIFTALVLTFAVACTVKQEKKIRTEQNQQTTLDSTSKIDSVSSFTNSNFNKRKQLKKPKKHALIVAIGKYPPANGWLPTHAANDISFLKSALAYQGFDTLRNVNVLQDEMATKQGIIKAIENTLIHGSNKGDKVVFHFSGHGQQVFDKSGDELDQYDEALVPYDAPLFVSDGYQGQLHLIDDELNELFYLLRKKLGETGSLLITLDACYSGTATRSSNSSGYIRGTNHKIIPDGSEFKKQEKDLSDNWNLANTDEDNTSLAPITVISASQADQVNHEVEIEPQLYVGSLSYGLYNTLIKCPATSSYRLIYNNLVNQITGKVPNQYPYAEGMLDYQIFTANPKKFYDFFTIVKNIDDTTVIVSGGLFSGLEIGMNVKVFPAYISDTSKASLVNQGKVIYADFWQSKIVLKQPLKNYNLSDFWVFPIKYSKSERSINVKFEARGFEWLSNSLDDHAGINVNEDKPDLLLNIHRKGSNEYQLKIKDEFFETDFHQSFTSDALLKEFVNNAIVKKINLIHSVNKLRKMNIKDPKLKVDFKLIPVAKNPGDSGKNAPITINKKYLTDDIIHLNHHANFKLKLVNHNDFPIYVSIIDIFPNHEVNQLYPVKPKNSAGYLVKSNQTLEIPYLYYTTEPWGIDFLKMIASDKPMQIYSYHNDELVKKITKMLPVDDTKENETGMNSKLTIQTIKYSTLQPGT